MAFKKTPKDATDFEREQLRFLMARTDVASILREFNPSLAWLPFVVELQADKARLAPWIEKNFADINAIREVASNIHLFVPETADVLELHLNKIPALYHLYLKIVLIFLIYF